MDLKIIYKFISYNVLVVISVWIFSVYFMDFNPTFFWIDSNWYLFFDLFPGDSHGSLNFSFYTSLAWGTIGFFHYMYIVTNNSIFITTNFYWYLMFIGLRTLSLLVYNVGFNEFILLAVGLEYPLILFYYFFHSKLKNK